MHYAIYILESIWRIGSRDNFNTDISKWFHIANMKEANHYHNQVKTRSTDAEA